MGIGTGLAAAAANRQTRNDETILIKEQTFLERETGIEPASLAWKARVLPLNYSRCANAPETPWSHDLPPASGPVAAEEVSLVEEGGFEPP
jgi:hypothetical protein